VARSSRFAQGVRWTARGIQPVRGWPGGCELEPGYDWFACNKEKFWSQAQLGPMRAQAQPPGVLSLSTGAAPSLTPGVGAQVALARLERGEVVVTSEPVERGEADAIVLRSLQSQVVHRVDRLPGTVRALAAGDLDGDGRAEVVAAVRDDDKGRTELWLVR